MQQTRNSANQKAAKHFTERFGVSASALRGWADAGRGRCFRYPRGKRADAVADVIGLLGVATEEGAQDAVDRRRVIYARVSSAKQRDDLKRQIDELVDAYPGARVFRDIGSGVNFKRRGLRALLEACDGGGVSQVVVMHRDRLARVGVDLVECLLERKGVELVVHRQGTGTDGPDIFVKDLLAIVTVFVASHHGKRAAEGRRRRRSEIEARAQEGAQEV